LTKEYDLVVLGGGTGGYVAAIRASQLGMQVAIVEDDKVGGTCLHRGCIPSKALLRSADIYRQTKSAHEYGIEVKETTLNFTKVQERKDAIVETLYQGVHGLMKKGKIDVYHGYGRILGPSIFSPMPGTISIEYENGDDNTMIVPKQVLIATGSKPKSLPGLEVDHTHIITSDQALDLAHLPKSIMIIGGGVIGIEWASMLADFDVDVTVIEYLDQILPTEDEAIAREARKQLTQKGITFITSATVLPATLIKDNGVAIDVDVNGDIATYKADQILMSVGREANRTNIGIENTEIEMEHDFIRVNENYQTKESHIYAIGDVIGGMQLAHVASHEGIIAVEHMANEQPFAMNYENVPSCIYSSPEIASVGLTEKESIEQGFEITVGQFPFQGIGKALVNGESEGFVKIVANKENDDILGIHMIGPHVTELISEAGLAKVLDATPWEISQTIHPHPTLSEVMGEAALAVEGKQIHG